jgi:Uma2 family endonuclease
VLAAPDHVVAELIDGEVHTSPRPAMPHAHSASRILGQLDGPFDRGRGGPGGWHIVFAPELHIVGQVMVPDIGGWRRERLVAIPDAPYMELAPDWLCEVMSPSTARLDRAQKLPHYARAGVSHLWLCDPTLRTLEVYRAEGGSWLLLATYAGDDKVHAEPFNAVELELQALWG